MLLEPPRPCNKTLNPGVVQKRPENSYALKPRAKLLKNKPDLISQRYSIIAPLKISQNDTRSDDKNISSPKKFHFEEGSLKMKYFQGRKLQNRLFSHEFLQIRHEKSP